jgi:hypothetical protein
MNITIKGKDRRLLNGIVYLLLSLGFPVSIGFWYLRNRRTVCFIYPVIILLIISAFALSSYVHVLCLTLKFKFNAFKVAVLLGDAFAIIFFCSRLVYPTKRAGSLFFFFYYLAIGLIIFSISSWVVIPRFYMAHGMDFGGMMLILLAIMWLAGIIVTNHYFSPLEEGISVSGPNDNWKILAGLYVSLIAFGALSYLVNIVIISRAILVAR